MLRNYLTVALRNLRKQNGYAFINVFGLALGMAACLLIFMLVRHEWRYDRFHDRLDRIHRVLILETRPDGTPDYRQLTSPSPQSAITLSAPPWPTR